MKHYKNYLEYISERVANGNVSGVVPRTVGDMSPDFSSQKKTGNMVANDLLKYEIIDHIMEKLPNTVRKRQRRIIFFTLQFIVANPNIDYRTMAKRLKVSPQAIHNVFKNLRKYFRGEDLKNILRRINSIRNRKQGGIL